MTVRIVRRIPRAPIVLYNVWKVVSSDTKHEYVIYTRTHGGTPTYWKQIDVLLIECLP